MNRLPCWLQPQSLTTAIYLGIVEAVGAKFCLHCGDLKRLRLFHTNPNMADGYQPTCALCSKLLPSRIPVSDLPEDYKPCDESGQEYCDQVERWMVWKHVDGPGCDYDELLVGQRPWLPAGAKLPLSPADQMAERPRRQ